MGFSIDVLFILLCASWACFSAAQMFPCAPVESACVIPQVTDILEGGIFTCSTDTSPNCVKYVQDSSSPTSCIMELGTSIQETGPQVCQQIQSEVAKPLDEFVFEQGSPVSLNGFPAGIFPYTGLNDAELRADSPDTNLNTGSGSNEFILVTEPSVSDVVIRFDNIFGTSFDQIAPGSTVYLAKLCLNIATAGDDMAMYDMMTDWGSESTVTWSLFGTDGPQAQDVKFSSQTMISANGDKVCVDVTKSLKAWSSGSYPNNGWLILPGGPNAVTISSSENANQSLRPYLHVYMY